VRVAPCAAGSAVFPPIFLAFSLYFGFVLCRLPSAQVLALSWVCLLIFGRVVRGLWWVCWVEVVSGLVWVFVGGFYCILGFMWASGVVGPCGFSSILFVG
jgi:hypothetical protein